MVTYSKFSTVCHICGITEDEFSKRSYFEKHNLLHQKINQSVCDTCGKSYPNLIALNKHVRVYHGKEHPCELEIIFFKVITVESTFYKSTG